MPSGPTHLRYTVLLEGFDLDGLQLDPRDPVQRLKETFGIETDAAVRLTSNLPSVVRRGAPEATAQEYANALRGIGATVELQIESSSLPRGNAVGAISSSRQIQKVSCPKCGFTQPSDDECLRCGAHLPAPDDPTIDVKTVHLGKALDFPLESDEVPVVLETDGLPVPPRSSGDGPGLGFDVPPPLPDETEEPTNLWLEQPKERESVDALPVPPGHEHSPSVDLFFQPEEQRPPGQQQTESPSEPEQSGAEHEKRGRMEPQKSAPTAAQYQEAADAVPLDNFFDTEETEEEMEWSESLDIAAESVPTMAPPAEAGVVAAGVVAAGVHQPVQLDEMPPNLPAPQPSDQPVDLSHLTAHAPPRRIAREQPASAFYTGIPMAFVAPFIGKGIGWLPILAVTLSTTSLGSCFGYCGTILFLAIIGFFYMGLQANYFARSVECGLHGENRAPDINLSTDLGEMRDQFFYPGAALAVLALLLFALPLFTMSSLGGSFGSEPDIQLVDQDQTLPPSILKVEQLHPPEIFYDAAGQTVTIDSRARSRMLVTHNDKPVYVEPAYRRVTHINELYLDEFEPLPAPTIVRKGGRGTFGLVLVFILALFPFYYWPMALTVAAVSNSLLSMFNPIVVLKAAFQGGLPYVIIAALGIVAPVGLGIIVSLVATAGAITGGGGAIVSVFLMGAFSSTIWAYVSGVQGQLMGILISTRADRFKDLTT